MECEPDAGSHRGIHYDSGPMFVTPGSGSIRQHAPVKHQTILHVLHEAGELERLPFRMKVMGKERIVPVQIGAKPDSGFDDPLEMLKDCHRRIEHFINILCVVAQRAEGRALAEDETAAVQAALNYFRLGGQRHTEDEEESLFPRLMALGGFSELNRLEHDHDEAGGLHAEVEALYQTWISTGSLNESQSRSLQSLTGRLRDLYQAHIQIEDNVIFPKAAEVLDNNTIGAIGQEFRARRQAGNHTSRMPHPSSAWTGSGEVL